MGRPTKIEQGPDQERIAIDRSIREHRYIGLDDIVADLTEQGITVTRSALHRYLVKLREKDSTLATPEEGTIVTIVERGTGDVRTVKSSASGAAIQEMILKLNPPEPVS
jgi:arginine repressor